MNLTSLFLFFVSLVLCECQGSIVSRTYGYHENIGIPKAQSLQRAEGLASRIVGGNQVATESTIPHQAGIIATLTTGWTSICGGTLISNSRVVTAAHCWFDGQSQARQFTVVLGSLRIFSGGLRRITTDVVVHPNWNPNGITHDIAIVRIEQVSFNNNIQPVTLPTLADVNVDFAGQSAIASGFGKTSDAQNNFPTTTSLYHITLTIISNAVCQSSFGFPLHAGHLCTSGQGGVGTCEGDSGGPLTVLRNNQRTLVGVVSFGLGNGCQLGVPSVFTRVTSFIGWIQANL